MTNKPVSIRYGSYTLNFHTEEEFWKSFTSLTREMFGHGGTKKIIGELAAEWFSKYEGKVGNMDQFLDKNFIPEPNLTASIEQKINFLKTQDDDTIHKAMDESYRLHIMCRALLDSPNKNTFNMNYHEAWQRYK